LTGTVRTEEQKNEAAEIARELAGVREVKSDIRDQHSPLASRIPHRATASGSPEVGVPQRPGAGR
jgi:hypothetical protein